MKVLILFPRLDTSFKNLGAVPVKRGPIIPIREHWIYLVSNLVAYHESRGDQYKIVERPLWQFSPDNIHQEDYDIVYVPHKEYHNFPLPEGKARYYMQTVFPEMFTIDKKGWGANLSYVPFSTPYERPDLWQEEAFDRLRHRINQNISKFDQPKSGKSIHSNILFVCQLPHDETIKYHSKVSVEAALETTLQWGQANRREVIVKGHPANPGSMEPLIALARKYGARYIDDVSIHDCLHGTNVAVMVNSGVGFEAMLHVKPIILFGEAEYSEVTTKSLPTINSFGEAMASVDGADYHRYVDYMTKWVDRAYHSKDSNTFLKLDLEYERAARI